MNNKFARWAAVAALLVATAGCGFHLRGANSTTSLEALTVTAADPYGELATAFEKEMRQLKIDKGGANAWQLVILEQELDNNVLAVSDTNNAATYEVELEVRFQALNPQGEVAIAPNTLRLVRNYEANNNRRLAMDRETQLLRNELYRDMARRLIERVNMIALQQR